MDPTTGGRAQVDSTAEPDVYANLASFSRHLRAETKAPSTIVTYSKAVTQLDSFLERGHRPRAVAELRREDLEAFLLDLQDAARQPATVAAGGTEGDLMRLAGLDEPPNVVALWCVRSRRACPRGVQAAQPGRSTVE